MIQETTANDHIAILQLTRNTGMFKDLEVDTLEEVLLDYENAVEYGHCCYTLFDENGEGVLGFIYFAPIAMTEGSWEVWWIVVDKNVQGQGYGKKLMSFAEEMILEFEGRLMMMDTSSLPHYAPTRDFYQNLGYQEVAHVPDYYAEGDGKVIFWKKLVGVVDH
ncbi:MAG: GNAT family N-acetyltransferase [Zavarzinella sp.]